MATLAARMFFKPAFQIIGYAGVQISISALEDINMPHTLSRASPKGRRVIGLH